METKVLPSLVLLLVASLPFCYLLHLLFSKLSNSKIVAGIMLVSFVVSSLAVWNIDMELPLSHTRIRSTGAVLPVYLAAFAWVVKFSFFACVIIGARTLRRLEKKA
jgi:hypothetical protein